MLRLLTVTYIDGTEASLMGDRIEDNGKEFVLYVPKKYVARTERGRNELQTMQG